MNLEEAAKIINNHNVKKEEEKRKKEEKAQQEYDKCYNEIQKLQPRIEKIIAIGNMCIENDIKLNSRMRGSRQFSEKYVNNEFVTDAIYHYLGFYPEDLSYSHFTFIGYIMGGVCGDKDFITNGEIIASTPHSDKYKVGRMSTPTMSTPTIKHMKRFIEDFDMFEKTFYKWIESL